MGDRERRWKKSSRNKVHKALFDEYIFDLHLESD